MDDILKKLRESFCLELNNYGDAWRILRKSTLVDLMDQNFIYYQNDKNEKYLVDIFNYSMKIKLLSRIEPIGSDESLDVVSKKFNKESEYIMKQYDNILDELHPSLNDFGSSKLNDLNCKIKFMKAIDDLKIENYVSKEVIGVVYNLLKS